MNTKQKFQNVQPLYLTSAVTEDVSPKKLRQVPSKLFLEYLNEQGTNRFSFTFLPLRQRVELNDSTDRSKNFDPVTCFTLRNNEWKSRPERRPCHRLLGILHCLTLRRDETKSQKRKQRRNSGEICSESKRVLDRFSQRTIDLLMEHGHLFTIPAYDVTLLSQVEFSSSHQIESAAPYIRSLSGLAWE